ncbi:hypothetical protein Gpo141_00005346 [Globisporangium polare]
MKTTKETVLLLLLAASLKEPLTTVGAFETELLRATTLQLLPYVLGPYVDLQDAIAHQSNRSTNSSSLKPEPATLTGHPLSSVPVPKDPEAAYVALIQMTKGYQSVFFGWADPLNPIPVTSDAKLQVAHQWLCPILGIGFAEYFDDTLSERVLYEELSPTEADDDEELRFDKQRWDEVTLQSARKFYARVQMELRLLAVSEAADFDAALETLFTRCVVTPLLNDMTKKGLS